MTERVSAQPCRRESGDCVTGHKRDAENHSRAACRTASRPGRNLPVTMKGVIQLLERARVANFLLVAEPISGQRTRNTENRVSQSINSSVVHCQKWWYHGSSSRHCIGRGVFLLKQTSS